MDERKLIASYGDDEILVHEPTGEPGIRTVTINRPEEHNVLTGGLMHAMAQAFDAITVARDPDPNDDVIRAVILRAEGKAFAAGLDIGKLDEYLSGGLSAERDPFRAIWECPFPVIGAVNGPAVTGGFEIALCCDILVASRHAVFLDNHGKYGVHPGRRISQRLPQICGVQNAKLASMAAYPIDAETALRWGLVQRVVPTREELDREALAIARMIGQVHPVMVKRYKELIDGGALGSYREGIALEESSEATYYDALSDVDATLADGAEKFQAMLRWIDSLD